MDEITRYDPADLGRVVRFFGECNRLTGLTSFWHVGDVLHFMCNGLRGRDIGEHLYLYEGRARGPESSCYLGAVIIIQRPGDASEFDVCVHPNLRGSAEEEALYEWAEMRAQEMALAMSASGTAAADGDAGDGAAVRSPRASAIDVPDCDRAKRDLLERMGYVAADEPHEEYTVRPLTVDIPAPVLPPGFIIRSTIGEQEADALGEVHSGSFGSSWKPGEYLNVMRTPGYVADRELVAVAPDGRLAAFLVYWPDPVSRSGLFEPVGCHKDFRRMGLSRALLYEGMRRMKAEGMETTVVEPLTATYNPAAYALYESVGFRRKYSIIKYTKAV